MLKPSILLLASMLMLFGYRHVHGGTPPVSDEHLYDLETQTLAESIAKFARQICTFGFNGYSYRASGSCSSDTCEITIEMSTSQPQGDVFLTPDFELLFAKGDTASLGDVRVERRRKAGVPISITRKAMPVVKSADDIASINRCFGEIARLIRSESKDSPKQLTDDPTNSISISIIK